MAPWFSENVQFLHIFENTAQPASHRFSSLETHYDPWTIRHLEATGIGPGWKCWEIGGVGGSIAAWLGERSGKSGHVLVTDIDPRFLSTLDQPTIEIRRHNIGTDPLPKQTFPSVHISCLLPGVVVHNGCQPLGGSPYACD